MSKEATIIRDSSRDNVITEAERKRLEAETEKDREEALAFLTEGDDGEDLDDDNNLSDEHDDADDQDDIDDAHDEEAGDDQDDGKDEDDDSVEDADEEDDEGDEKPKKSETSEDDADEDGDKSVDEDEAHQAKADKADEEFAKNLDRETKKRFNRALRQRSELRERLQEREAELESEKAYGNYGRTIATFAKNNSMSDADLSNWLERGAEIQKIPQTVEAVGAHLVKWAEQMGYKVPSAEAAKPNLAPVQAKLKEMMDSFAYVDENTARDLMGLINEAVTQKPAEPAAPAASPAATPLPNAQQNQQPIMNMGFSESDKAAGTTALAERMGAAKNRLGHNTYNKIIVKVNKRLAKYRGVHPSQWPEVFDDALALEERKLSRSEPQKKKPNKTIRANNRSDETRDKEGELSERDKAIADLTGESIRR